MDDFSNIAKTEYDIFVEKKLRIPSFYMSYEHYHNYCELYYLKTGKCIYTIKGMEYQLKAGDFLIIAPGEPHFTRYEGQTSCERVVFCCQKTAFPKEFQENFPEVIDILDKSCKITLEHKKQCETDSLIQRILQENNLKDEYSSETIRYLLLCLFLTLKRDGHFMVKTKIKETYSKAINEAVEYITRNFSLPITLEDVAQQVGLSPTYFSKKFHLTTGSTFKKYLNEIRILQARQMLLTTDDSITKIALSCGFNSSNYFKDIFRRRMGISPRTYRKKSKEAS